MTNRRRRRQDIRAYADKHQISYTTAMRALNAQESAGKDLPGAHTADATTQQTDTPAFATDSTGRVWMPAREDGAWSAKDADGWNDVILRDYSAQEAAHGPFTRYDAWPTLVTIEYADWEHVPGEGDSDVYVFSDTNSVQIGPVKRTLAALLAVDPHADLTHTDPLPDVSAAASARRAEGWREAMHASIRSGVNTETPDCDREPDMTIPNPTDERRFSWDRARARASVGLTSVTEQVVNHFGVTVPEQAFEPWPGDHAASAVEGLMSGALTWDDVDEAGLDSTAIRVILDGRERDAAAVREVAAEVTVGDRIRPQPHGGRTWWTVQARNERYLVATRPEPFASKGAGLQYTVIDLRSTMRHNGAYPGVARSSLDTLGGGWDINPGSPLGDCEAILRNLTDGDVSLSPRSIVQVTGLDVKQ